MNHICIYMSMYICTDVLMYRYTDVQMYICIYVHMYVCTYVCMYVCVYIYIHMREGGRERERERVGDSTFSECSYHRFEARQSTAPPSIVQ